MNPVVEQMLIKSNEQKKKDRKMLSNMERACAGCGSMIKLEDRPVCDKKCGRVRPCVVCENKRKEKYRKNK